MNKKGYCNTGSFLQRDTAFFTSADGLLSDKALCLAADKKTGAVYIGTDEGLNYQKADGSFGSFQCGAVKVLFAAENGCVYFASENTVYSLNDGKISEMQTMPETVAGISGDKDVFLITESAIYKLGKEIFEGYYFTEAPARGVAASNGKIVGFSDRCFMIFAGKRKHWMCVYPDYSTMPAFKINSVTFDKKTGFVWLGTDKGAYIYDNSCGWFGSDELCRLPGEAVNNITFGDKGEVLFSTEAGLCVLKNGSLKYLPATRYSCEEKINDAVMCGSGIWTATDSGVSKITYKPMTLKEKADWYFEQTEKYYIRKPGFVTGVDGIKNGDMSEAKPCITDNDGLWTHLYVGALSYNYAVTKDEKVLEAARRSMKAVAILTKITGKKGFTARAVRFEGDPGYGIGLEEQRDWCEWHKAPDGTTEWLGETSSDEMTGHYFGFCAYYDYCANEEEKAYISEIIRDITDHIIENNYRLCDVDGLPTTWACWDPAELNRNSMWLWEKCVNSLEILTFLKVAYHITGDEKYNDEYMRLGVKEHYFINAAQHKRPDGRLNHIDDNLGFLCSVTLLRLEEDESIRTYFLMGLKHHWEYERVERCAWYNFIYGAFTGEPCDIDTGIRQLQDYPLNFTSFKMFNSKRKNLVYDTEQEYWGEDSQLTEPLNIDERVPCNYDTNIFQADCGNSKSAPSPTSWLLPYWFGRLFGLIEEEE